MKIASETLKDSVFMEVNITNTGLFRFTHPRFDLGQKVKTRDELVGYIVGLDFYPETETWGYGVYILNSQNELVEEIWYEADQLRVLN